MFVNNSVYEVYVCFFQYPKVNKVQKGKSNRLHEYVPTHFASFLRCGLTLFKHVPMCVSLKLKPFSPSFCLHWSYIWII